MGAWILATVGLVCIVATATTALHWLLKGHRETVELLVRNNQAVAETFKALSDDYLEHLKNAAPIGGLPRDLWMEQHDLKKKEQSLRERQLEIETPLRRAALEHKLRKGGKLNGAGRVLDPES